MAQTTDRTRFFASIFLVGCITAAAGTISGSLVGAVPGIAIMITVIVAMHISWPLAGLGIKTPLCEKCGRQTYSPRPDTWRCSNYNCSQFGKNIDDRGLRK